MGPQSSTLKAISKPREIRLLGDRHPDKVMAVQKNKNKKKMQF